MPGLDLPTSLPNVPRGTLVGYTFATLGVVLLVDAGTKLLTATTSLATLGGVGVAAFSCSVLGAGVWVARDPTRLPEGDVPATAMHWIAPIVVTALAPVLVAIDFVRSGLI